MGDILREHSDLSDAQVGHLRALVSEWMLLSDLGFADLVLWVPTWNTGGFVAAAQVRPSTGPTGIPDDIVGQFVARGRNDILDRAALTRELVIERWDERPLVPRSNEAIPVMYDGAVIAVLERYSSLEARADGALERVYLQTFDALAEMVCSGVFPLGDASGDATPRVGDGLFLVDEAGIVVYASPNARSACHRLGVVQEVVGAELDKTMSRLAQKSGVTNDSLAGVASGRVRGEAEVEHRGTVVSLHSVPLIRHGRADGALVLLRDVSDLRRREKALLTKDATIREIHHRVKNNLQTVASMLRLQARRSSSEEVRAELDEAVRRVAAIAVVHETLAHEPGALVDFDEVIDRIISMSRDMAAGKGVIKRSGVVGTLEAERATPLAMSIAELIGNAVEHGLGKHNATGIVEVLAERGDRLVLHIDDNGPGAIDAEEGLGLTIVRSLVTGELRGRLQIAAMPAGGTRATIDIPSEP